MEKVGGYKPGGTLKGRQYLASSTEGWPEEERVMQQEPEHRAF